MNDLIVNYRLYAPYIMYAVGFILMMIVSITTCKKHNLSKLSAFMFTLVSYVGGVTGAMFMGDQFTRVALKYGGRESVVAIFGAVMFVPIFIIGAALVSGKPWRNVMDTMAPGGFIILTCAKFGCYIFGCCPGIPCSFGAYNYLYKDYMFPSQLLESITMCFVVGFCFWYGLKYKNRIPGKAYPYTIIIYSITRFGWEFLRYYDVEEMRHMLFGMTFWQQWCIVTFFEGLVWLLILRIPGLEDSEERFYCKHRDLVSKIKNRIPFYNSKTSEG